MQGLRLGMNARTRYRQRITSRAIFVSMMTLLSGHLGAL
jgi:hypothetical protein